MSERRQSVCLCGRSPDPGVRPGGGCYCADGSPLGAVVQAAKEHLLNSIEYLRREVSYDYPPRRVRELVRGVHLAEIAYREAWHEAQRSAR